MRSGRGYRRLRQASPETVGYPRLPRSLQEVSEWPQAARHKSTFSIRPGVRDRAQLSVCLPVPGGPSAPLSMFSLLTVLMSQALRLGSSEQRKSKGVLRCMFSLDHPRFAACGLSPPQSCTQGVVTGAVLLARTEAGISQAPLPGGPLPFPSFLCFRKETNKWQVCGPRSAAPISCVAKETSQPLEGRSCG